MNRKIKLTINQPTYNTVELEYNSIIEACNAVQHLFGACIKNTKFEITWCDEGNEEEEDE